MRKDTRPELVRRVGIKAVHNQNTVERLHGTLKDRLKPTRGLKGEETVRKLLEGWVVHYNYVRKHQTLKGKTPANASGINMENDWNTLIRSAIVDKTRNGLPEKERRLPVEVIAK